MSDRKNVYQRIIEVQKVVDYVQKERGAGQGHNAVTHDGVVAKIRQALIDQDLVFTLSLRDRDLLPPLEGKAMRLYTAQYEAKLTCADEPKDNMIMQVEGHGADSSDKSPGKAMSYATKTFFLKLFLIETGDNEESRTHDPADSPITPFQLEKISNLMKETDTDLSKMTEVIKTQYNVAYERLSDFNVGWAQWAIDVLEKKVKPSA